MNCEELLRQMNEYVDGAVDPALYAEFEKHLSGCNPCQLVVDTLRKTITLYKSGQRYVLPMPFKERLHSSLRSQWNLHMAPGPGCAADQKPIHT